MQDSRRGFAAWFKNRSRPRRPWIVIMGIAVISCCFLLVFSFYQLKNREIRGKAKTSAVQKDVRSVPGGNATEKYRETVREMNKREAEEAEREGKSFVPAVEGQDDSGAIDRIKKEKPEKKEKAEEAKSIDYGRFRALEARMEDMLAEMRSMQRQWQRQLRSQRSRRRPESPEQNYSKQYGKQLSRMIAELETDLARQEVLDFEQSDADRASAPEARERPASRTGEAWSASPSDFQENALGIAPGDILYARSELLLNSDTPGPAQATVLSGKYRGAKLLGGFEKQHDFLRVAFDRMITPDGRQFEIDALAIDPGVPSSAVRSDVNRHILSRWGGLMAASFLAGFGEAVEESGTDVVVTGETAVKSEPDLDTEEELWSAAGNVGEELSDVLDDNFNRPSTVTLEPGTNIGVLFLSVKS